MATLVSCGVDRNFPWGVCAIGPFWLKSLINIRHLKNAKTTVYLLLSSLGLGVQMPHCSPPGYATAYRGRYL